MKVYSITENGLAALRRWVTDLVEAPPRNEFVLKIYSPWLADLVDLRPRGSSAYWRMRRKEEPSKLEAEGCRPRQLR